MQLHGARPLALASDNSPAIFMVRGVERGLIGFLFTAAKAAHRPWPCSQAR
jgi:hypothetical protein